MSEVEDGRLQKEEGFELSRKRIVLRKIKVLRELIARLRDIILSVILHPSRNVN